MNQRLWNQLKQQKIFDELFLYIYLENVSRHTFYKCSTKRNSEIRNKKTILMIGDKLHRHIYVSFRFLLPPLILNFCPVTNLIFNETNKKSNQKPLIINYRLKKKNFAVPFSITNGHYFFQWASMRSRTHTLCSLFAILSAKCAMHWRKKRLFFT